MIVLIHTDYISAFSPWMLCIFHSNFSGVCLLRGAKAVNCSIHLLSQKTL